MIKYGYRDHRTHNCSSGSCKYAMAKVCDHSKVAEHHSDNDSSRRLILGHLHGLQCLYQYWLCRIGDAAC